MLKVACKMNGALRPRHMSPRKKDGLGLRMAGVSGLAFEASEEGAC